MKQAFEDELHELEEENRVTYITSIELSGMAKGLQEGIGTALVVKFGPAGKRLMPRVRKILDVDELHALLKVIPSAEKLQEIRDRLPPR